MVSRRHTLAELLQVAADEVQVRHFTLDCAYFRFADECLVIEGIDKDHELVIYSDLSVEQRTI